AAYCAELGEKSRDYSPVAQRHRGERTPGFLRALSASQEGSKASSPGRSAHKALDLGPTRTGSAVLWPENRIFLETGAGSASLGAKDLRDTAREVCPAP